jgi:hypothetical protein
LKNLNPGEVPITRDFRHQFSQINEVKKSKPIIERGETGSYRGETSIKHQHSTQLQLPCSLLILT